MSLTRKQVLSYVVELIDTSEISESTVATYASCLTTLWLRMGLEKEVVSADDFRDYQTAHAVIKKIKALRSKGVFCSAMIRICGPEQEELWKVELDKIRQSLNSVETAQKTPASRKKLNLTYADIRKMHSENVESFFAGRLSFDDFALSCFYSGAYGVPPRRLADMASVKLKDFDKDKDNFFDGNSIVFNGKTKTKSKAVVPLPDSLKLLLTTIAKQKSQFSNASSRMMNYNLTRLFGCSCNHLRSLYVSDFHKGTPPLQRMQELAQRMGNSVGVQLKNYTKKD